MQVFKQAYKHILVLQDFIITYYQRLENNPPSIVTRSSRFVSWFASVPEDGKTNHCLVSLEKYISKRLYLCNRGKIIPTTISIIETKNARRELNSSTEAIGLL